ncbi:MAG: copper amine oxidase N-terminal domain-containing protein [Methylocystaceae bacterium]
MIKLRNILMILTLIASFLMTNNQPVFSQQPTPQKVVPKVILDGRQVTFDVPPVIENGRILVPLRAIFEALGATVNWDESTQSVTASKVNTTISLKINATTASLNGQPAALDVPAKIIKNRTLVPLRFVSEALGAGVDWSDSTQTASISSPQITPVSPQASDTGEQNPSNQVVNLDDKCFKFYSTETHDEITTFVIRDALPPTVRNFTNIRAITFLSNNTLEQAVEVTQRDIATRQNAGTPYDSDKGFASWAASGIEAHMNMVFLYADKRLLGYHKIEPEELVIRPVKPDIKISSAVSQAVNITDSDCFAVFRSDSNSLLTFVFREKLPANVQGFTNISTSAHPASWTIEQAIDQQIKDKTPGFPYHTNGHDCRISGVDNCLLSIALLDNKGNILAYHLIKPEEIDARKDLMIELLVTFASPVHRDRLNWGDFTVIRKINGQVDPDYKDSGGRSIFARNSEGDIVSVELQQLLRENDDVTYEVQAKDSSTVIKDVRMQSPLWDD